MNDVQLLTGTSVMFSKKFAFFGPHILYMSILLN